MHQLVKIIFFLEIFLNKNINYFHNDDFFLF